jgi:hypothetical protein
MRLRLPAFAALLAAVALLLGACGSDDDSSNDAIGGDYGEFFGIAPSETPNEADLARMTAGGIGSYHLLFAWVNIEKQKGVYDWAAYDAEFSQLAAAGIEPIPYVVSTPGVYSDVGTNPPTDDEETFDAYADFLKAAVGRYGEGGAFWEQLAETDPDIEPRPVKTWEIWNEPNSSVFWTPAPDPDAYAELIKRSSRVIKAEDPTAEVMTAGMFITPQSEGAIESTDFLRQVYDHNGVADAVDVVALHPYGPSVDDVMDQVDETEDVIADLDPDAAMWITEIGWGSDPS